MDASDHTQQGEKEMGLNLVYAPANFERESSFPLVINTRTSDIGANDMARVWTEALICTLSKAPEPKASSVQDISWQELALSVVRQSLCDAGCGDYDALLWLVNEGRDWLSALEISPAALDAWALELLA